LLVVLLRVSPAVATISAAPMGTWVPRSSRRPARTPQRSQASVAEGSGLADRKSVV
jgi:hypothetical protein